MCNGSVRAQGSQFSLGDVEVITATIDLEEVRAYRSSVSRGLQAIRSTKEYRRIDITGFSISHADEQYEIDISSPRDVKIIPPEEEIALGPALWLVRITIKKSQSPIDHH